MSGGFDPLHSGHVRLIKDAAKFGRLYIALSADKWLKKSKGHYFMTWDERAEILRALCGVADVLPIDDADGTVCRMLRRVNPDFFALGGDGKRPHPSEREVCAELGIRVLYDVGGHKIKAAGALVTRMRT